MALGDPYATVPELEARLGSADDGNYEALLDAASRAVEAFTRRQFNRTDEASPRRFRPLDPRRLPTDDFHTLDDFEVEVRDVAWSLDNLDLRPWNGVVNGVPGWPYFDIFAVGRVWPWTGRLPGVTVTAQWGWAAVPAAIKQTTLNVAVRVQTGASSEASSGPVKAESIDGYSVSYVSSDGTAVSELVDLTTFSLAQPYKRIRFGVA